MTNYSDEQIKNLLTKLRDKRRRYLNRNDYEAQQMKDIFAQTGLFKQNGRIVSVEEFKEKMGGHINYGVAMIQEKLNPNYIRDINKKYKENIATMLNMMGLEEESEKVARMGYREFMRLDKQGTWDYVQEQYDTYDTISLAEEISGVVSGNEKEQLSKDVMQFLGFL